MHFTAKLKTKFNSKNINIEQYFQNYFHWQLLFGKKKKILSTIYKDTNKTFYLSRKLSRIYFILLQLTVHTRYFRLLYVWISFPPTTKHTVSAIVQLKKFGKRGTTIHIYHSCWFCLNVKFRHFHRLHLPKTKLGLLIQLLVTQIHLHRKCLLILNTQN